MGFPGLRQAVPVVIAKPGKSGLRWSRTRWLACRCELWFYGQLQTNLLSNAPLAIQPAMRIIHLVGNMAHLQSLHEPIAARCEARPARPGQHAGCRHKAPGCRIADFVRCGEG